MKLTHVLLLQADADAPQARAFAAGLPDLLLAHLGLAVEPPRLIHAAATGRLYAYVALARPKPLAAEMISPLSDALTDAMPALQGMRASRLERVFDIAGASAGQRSAFHYVVEMDPEPGWQAQLFEWYDVEHMPGLAAVPGCVHAARYLNHDHGPLSLACYDLLTPQTKGSPPWMAMTNSEWSSRVRPHFTNTIRTMFDVLIA